MYKTEQESFWAGDFGNEYIERNMGKEMLAANLGFFSNILSKLESIESCIELGTNIGMNLQALDLLLPNCKFHGVEINTKAVNYLRKTLPNISVTNSSILDYKPSKKFDLVFVKTVLIHISPNSLRDVYEKLYKSSKKYILMCEYFNPTPIEIEYRGHSNKLFKRDFASELRELYPDLVLRDYGFSYLKAAHFSQDDLNWFLFEKR